jgi:hypothetical protein
MPSKAQRKGYASNKLARQFLLDNNYEWIWFKGHQRHQDTVFINKEGTTLACTDIWGLFDGIAFRRVGNDSKWHVHVPIFLQIKTNSWRGWKDIQDFCKDKAIGVLFINVAKGKVKVRRI